jgi:hypothetical protein
VADETTVLDAEDVLDYEPGVLSAIEISDQDDAELSDEAIKVVKELRLKASRKDYPARLTEVLQSWEARLFWRGFQFLLPRRGGPGYEIPGEGSYNAQMQADLALLPTNIYSSYGQMAIATLTREIPSTIFQPQDASSSIDITAADSAEKFVRVIERNNDLMGIQTDAARYLWTDGRAHYWTRFVKDGQKFGWEEDDEQPVVPETEPPTDNTNQQAGTTTQPDVISGEVGQCSDENSTEGTAPQKARTPRGQEVRTAYGKLEVKIEMKANTLRDTYFLDFREEVDLSTAKGMFPKKADKVKSGGTGFSEDEIDRLARINCKLGMQATYVTSDSIGTDVTIDRTWFRPAVFTTVKDVTVRQELLTAFPDGMFCCYAGDEFMFARNESMDWSWNIMQAYSGDGQNRNAMGTSIIPVQKRLNNWYDLMNDVFIRTVPMRWYDNQAFAEAAINRVVTPGQGAHFQSQPGKTVEQLIFVEPAVTVNQSLPDFVKEYSGELAQLLSGMFPALFGGNTGSNDTASGIGIQRDAALGRIAPTWHSIKQGEAVSMWQAVRWAAKCRDGSINEAIPGGEPIKMEVNDLGANIIAFCESDENIPESYPAKQGRIVQLFQDAAKNPELAEVFFAPQNLELVQQYMGFSDMYIAQVESFKKQLGEIQVLTAKGNGPVPNPALVQAQQTIAHLLTVHGVDPQMLAQAQQEMEQLPPEISSVSIDSDVDDNDTEAKTCWAWLTSTEGRKEMRSNPNGYSNVRLHYLEHKAAAAAQQQSQGKVAESLAFKDLPPSGQVQEAAQAGIKLNPADVAQAPVAPPQQAA